MTDTLYLLWTWIQVHKRMGLGWNLGDHWELRSLHHEDQRHYHTWHHIAQAMRFLDRYEDEDLDPVRLALFFHDAVYDPRARDNEERSADLWRHYADEHGVSDGDREVVTNLILMTRDHVSDGSWLQDVMGDADMSIFLAESHAYGVYATDIWREYHHVGADAYREGRLKFLRSLSPATMFNTTVAARDWTHAACNVAWETVVLEGDQRSRIITDAPGR